MEATSKKEAMGKFEVLGQSVKKRFDLLSGLTGEQQQETSSPLASTSSVGLPGAGSLSSGMPNLPLESFKVISISSSSSRVLK